MSEPKIPAPSAAVPRFSLRWMLALVTASAVFFLVVRAALAGHAWATAVTVAVLALLLTLALHGLVFSILCALAESRNRLSRAGAPRTRLRGEEQQ